MRAQTSRWFWGMLCLGLMAGCGHSANDLGSEPSNSNLSVVNDATENKNVAVPPGLTAKQQAYYQSIDSDSYGGKLTVFFKEPQQENTLAKNFPNLQMRRSVPRNFEEEQKRSKKVFDWNKVYIVETKDKVAAKKQFLELIARKDIALVYPEQKKYPPGLGSTPNLDGYQTYLDGPASAGLNIRQAWADGVYGAGVTVAAADTGFYIHHAQFELVDSGISAGGNIGGWICTPEASDFNVAGDCTSTLVAHGTAVLGLLNAQHGLMGGRGIKGIAPNAYPWVGVNDLLNLPRGSVVVLECAVRSSYRDDGEEITCADGHAGFACIPCEAGPLDYLDFREATDSKDILIVSTSGNGAVNLDETQLLSDSELETICGPRSDPATADCWESSGALLVGGNQGDREMSGNQPHKASWSNCGAKVQVNAWGERVVTTTWFEDEPISGYAWSATGSGSDPLNDDPNSAYTNQFGGTSSATAIVGGVAVLVQSYFKDIANGTPAGDSSLALSRYLTPAKLKEILIQSGTEAYTDDGCPVGVQPDVGVAFELTRGFWNTTRILYPELASGGSLSVAEMNALHNLGVGMVCEGDLAGWDPACPPVEDVLVCDRENTANNPAECISRDVLPHLAKEMDFDEDGRGDLVQYVNGSWKIDLSSRGSGTDHLGGWDLTITTPRLSKGIPVAADYNSDGKTDLAVYNRADGKFYIAFTDDNVFRDRSNISWDLIVNWPGTADRDTYENILYTRPLPADYNGDGWIDLGVTTSDGHWKMSFGWRIASDAAWQQRRYRDFGPLKPDYANSQWKQDVTFLTAEELAAYPGWAYVPVSVACENEAFLAYRSPNGTIRTFHANTSFGWEEARSFPGLEHLFVKGLGVDCDYYGLKQANGDWYSYDGSRSGVISNESFGAWQCKPASYDMDGDGYDEAIVYCPSDVRVLFSASGEFRHIPLGYANSAMLPGRPIFGGLNYDRVLQVRSKMKELKMTTIPPLFDYLITPYEYCNLSWSRSDLPEECR